MSIANQEIAILKTNVNTKILKKIAVLIIPAFVLWGCESTPEQVEDTGAGSTAQSTTDSGATASGTDTGSGSTAKPMAQDTSSSQADDMLSKNIVYFDFDKNDVKDDFKGIIQAHANYLSNNPSAKMTVEGNADERGTREYNIGLGERRANAVRQLLVLQGASSSQVDVISYGEERPAVIGHDESAWSKNRRAELIYSSR